MVLEIAFNEKKKKKGRYSSHQYIPSWNEKGTYWK